MISIKDVTILYLTLINERQKFILNLKLCKLNHYYHIEPCEMRDENILWNELCVYDDIVNLVD